MTQLRPDRRQAEADERDGRLRGARARQDDSRRACAGLHADDYLGAVDREAIARAEAEYS